MSDVKTHLKIIPTKFCGYCGADDKKSLSTEQGLKITPKAFKKFDDNNGRNVYSLVLCPACLTIIDIDIQGVE